MTVEMTRDWIDHVTAIAVLLTALVAVGGMLAAMRDASRARAREREEASYSRAHMGRADAMAALHQAEGAEDPQAVIEAVDHEIARLKEFLAEAADFSDTHRARLFAHEVDVLERRLHTLRSTLGD